MIHNIGKIFMIKGTIQRIFTYYYTNKNFPKEIGKPVSFFAIFNNSNPFLPKERITATELLICASVTNTFDLFIF